MKTTSLRILFTLAILVGMAAAPGAQTFRWEPNNQVDVRARVRINLDHVQDSVDRALARVERDLDRRINLAARTAERASRTAERRAQSVVRQVQRRVDAQVRREVQRNIQLGNRYVTRGSRGMNYGDNAGAQVGTNDDPCSNRYNDRDDDYFQHCEVRDSTMPAGPLNVDAGQNGGIVIEGWDRNEIRVRAVVQGSARSEARARDIAGQVQVQTGGGRAYATGPDLERREWWSVSYRINVPRKNDLDLRASNGGITIVGVTGNMRFDTTNGGVKVQRR
jgi:hypothetical protein